MVPLATLVILSSIAILLIYVNGGISVHSKMASAIAKAEGFGVADAIPTLAHNPGDLVLGDIGFGIMGAGITVFASDADGWTALEKELELIKSGTSTVYSLSDTIAIMASRWTQTEQSSWASNVASTLGVSVNTPLSQILT